MKPAHIVIAGTLTFNIALTAALVRANTEFAAIFRSDEIQIPLMEKPPLENKSPATSGLTRSQSTQLYILDTNRTNPDAVVDALLSHQLQQQVEQVPAYTQELKDPEIIIPIENEHEATPRVDAEDATNAPVGGNQNGDITIVEFFDYNCTHCRASTPILDDVVGKDGNVRVIYREFPILGNDSIVAARAALASRQQGMYAEFHKALMSASSHLDEAKVMAVAKSTGLDIKVLKSDMKDPMIAAHIEKSLDLAAQYDFNGTPSFIIGGVKATGRPTKAALEGVISQSRDKQ
jgi:protein-disulfide isomerase